jgi:hypothetical protein
MKFIKKHLDNIERCYCIGHVVIDGETYALFASEQIGGACYAYSGSDFSVKETVWENAGGTMSIVEIPGLNGQFLGVQNFFPGFNAGEAKIVWGMRDRKKGWIIRDFLNIPYVHRFDIISSGGVNYFLAATLCGSKREREDWSDPGKIYVGVLPDRPDQPMEIVPLIDGLVKNHGYWRGNRDGRPCGYFTCESGVYAVSPPKTPDGSWKTHRILENPVSDVAIYDLNGDGEDEIIAIEPFHGDCVNIYHRLEGEYRAVYTYPGECKFAHALWAGRLKGMPAALLGIRRANAELVLIRYCPQKGTYVEQIIDDGFGPSNVGVVVHMDNEYILCANNSKHEAAAYLVSD